MLKGWAKEHENELFISRNELANVYREICENIDFDFYYADISNDVYHLDKKGEN